jgi:hypothetical protein
MVKRKTAKDRFRRSLKAIAEWCRAHRHRSLEEQQAALTAKLRGHFAYYLDFLHYSPASHRRRRGTPRCPGS